MTIIKISSWKTVHINHINMLYYDEIDISEGIDINEASASKECDICQYWYLDKGLSFNRMSAMDV